VLHDVNLDVLYVCVSRRDLCVYVCISTRFNNDA